MKKEDQIKKLYDKGYVLWLHHHNYAEALIYFEKILELDPFNTDALHLSEGCLFKLDRFYEAHACLEKITEIDPSNLLVWYEKAGHEKNLGRLKDALISFKYYLSKTIPEYDSLHRVDSAHKKVKEIEDELLHIDPYFPKEKTWSHKGYIFKNLENIEKSLYCFGMALKENPNDIFALSEIGYLLRREKRYDDAIIFIDQALTIDSSYSKVWETKGILLKILGKKEEALSCFTRCLENDPTNGNVWMDKCFLELELGMKQDAAISIHQAIAYPPKGYPDSAIEVAQKKLREL